MMQNNPQNVLITGGTKGLGLMLAKVYTENGARVNITHRWGSISDVEVYAVFDTAKLPRPQIYCVDTADHHENINLLKNIADKFGCIDVFISNVAFAQIAGDVQSLKKNTLDISLQYSAWPLIAITQLIYDVMQKYPKYIIGVSSNGPDICHPGYDYVACSKAVLETLMRYLSLRLREHDCCVNCIRPGFLNTDSTRSTFGEKFIEALYEKAPDIFIDPYEVAKVCVALTSGLMDVVKGQVITADNGHGLISPLALYSKMIVD